MTTHTLSAEEGHAVVLVLRSQHIPVTFAVIGDITHIHPHRPISTDEEVKVLRAFAAVTDSVQYHDWHAFDGAA